jgi:ATP-binding cassette subfamily B protein
MKWMRRKFQKQFDSIDCGPSCLKMIAGYYGKNYPLEYLRNECYLSREGVSLLSINDAAEKIGFKTLMSVLDREHLYGHAPLPCVLHWNQNHFVVLYDIRARFMGKGRRMVIADPAHGIIKIDQHTFERSWLSTHDGKGAALFMEPTTDFFGKKPVKEERKSSFGFLFQYLKPYSKYLLQLIAGMVAASVLSFIFPVLTQLLIDNGVTEKNISLVKLILFSQVFIFVGSTLINIIRSWLLLHINARISLSIISDFLVKLLKLPIKYFDTKAVGDLSQRINDHHRIESFLTGEALGTVFSIINIIVFTLMLGYYNGLILFIFLLASALGIGWIFLFRKKRAFLDYKRFARAKENQDKLFELITGMQEIKLYGSETSKRWEWEALQVKTFRLNIKSLALEQYQQTGYIFFNHFKNILISYVAAREVIAGNITLGILLSISYIIGQTNAPLEQLISFIKAAQDARLSMNRLQEVHAKTNEEDDPAIKAANDPVPHQDIHLNNVSFQYEGPHSPFVLKDIDITLPKGKVTAIVGTSGSGKTTLMKLLLNFYQPVTGAITIGPTPLPTISPKLWRHYCGTVMQEGYIFFDTIARNIALDGKPIDDVKMEQSVHIANLAGFIGDLPLGYTTRIGNSGLGISGGQKQRIMIARAVYKDPDYLFFDEATSSLDANNEFIIMNNLKQFFKGKTVMIIAHRLSTVKNADQIVVLEQGKVVEVGNHNSLVAKQGKYFELVKNQLELGK